METTAHPRDAAWARLSVPARAREIVARHRFLAYLVVAYGLSWSVWVTQAVSGLVVVPGGSATHVPGLFGPMIAAFAITALADGSAGVRDIAARMVRWRVSPRWYALAMLPFLFFLAGAGLSAVAGGPLPDLADLARYSGVPEIGLPAVLVIAFLANGYGEEVGWRGFAQPSLRRTHGFLSASIVVAAAWALWHVPSFWVIETYRLMGLAVVPIFVLGLGSGAIVFGWLYERSGGNILIAALAHLSLNMGSATVAGRGLPQMLVTSGIVVWAALIVAVEARRAGGLRRVAGGIGRAFMIRLLRSSLGRGIGRTVTVVTYRGRATGRQLATPVEYVRHGSRVTILVADPEHKQWWRNVRVDGNVSLLFDGVERTGRATVVEPPGAVDLLADVVDARPRAARAAASGAVAVIVELRDDGR